MSGTVLFCIADEARNDGDLPFVRYTHFMSSLKRQFAQIILEPMPCRDNPDRLRWFYIAETRIGPPPGTRLRKEIDQNEAWQNDFAGVSEQACQEWLQERQAFDRSIFGNTLVIVDERSARDHTALVQRYVASADWYSVEDEVTYGVLAAQPNKWYNFRVDYRAAPDLINTLEAGAPHLVYLALFAGISELTTAEGLVDMERLDKIMSGREQIDADAEGQVVFG